MDIQLIRQAAKYIKAAQHAVAFTGAGISVESGIPPFRGPGGLWSKYDPSLLEIHYFLRRPAEVWKHLQEIFYTNFTQAEPNAAHSVLARMEAAGLLQGVITQNIDNLHQEAGSQNVIEYHGNLQRLVCVQCHQTCPIHASSLETLPPRCAACGGMLKPDCVFFGEAIPPEAHHQGLAEVQLSDVWLVIGTTGEVMPACQLPRAAHHNGATIIEINIQSSRYTNQITDIFLQGRAAEIATQLWEILNMEDTL